MILTTLMIGGLFLMATAIAGLLMFYQLQQATDFGNSTIAIFAADANLERAIYYYFYEYQYNPYNPGLCFPQSCDSGAPVNLSNGASGSSNLIIPPPDIAIFYPTTTITAIGFDVGGRTIRLLQTTLRPTAEPLTP